MEDVDDEALLAACSESEQQQQQHTAASGQSRAATATVTTNVLPPPSSSVATSGAAGGTGGRGSKTTYTQTPTKKSSELFPSSFVCNYKLLHAGRLGSLHLEPSLQPPVIFRSPVPGWHHMTPVYFSTKFFINFEDIIIAHSLKFY